MQAPRFRSIAGLVITAAVCLSISGCGESKVNKANFDKLQLEMTKTDVESILGEGTYQGDPSSGVASQFGVNLAPSSNRDQIYLWESGNKSITLHFRGDKLKYKTSVGL
ncbi:MAG: hypothetical protein L0Y72_07810 [Gemmataceae bacterium]|nr:hypothetical protein [Gemmataceae bacterium]MCI0738934.1 hypothetical protein [Gemmataceae bacterium]